MRKQYILGWIGRFETLKSMKRPTNTASSDKLIYYLEMEHLLKLAVLVSGLVATEFMKEQEKLNITAAEAFGGFGPQWCERHSYEICEVHIKSFNLHCKRHSSSGQPCVI